MEDYHHDKHNSNGSDHDTTGHEDATTEPPKDATAPEDATTLPEDAKTEHPEDCTSESPEDVTAPPIDYQSDDGAGLNREDTVMADSQVMEDGHSTQTGAGVEPAVDNGIENDEVPKYDREREERNEDDVEDTQRDENNAKNVVSDSNLENGESEDDIKVIDDEMTDIEIIKETDAEDDTKSAFDDTKETEIEDNTIGSFEEYIKGIDAPVYHPTVHNPLKAARFDSIPEETLLAEHDEGRVEGEGGPSDEALGSEGSEYPVSTQTLCIDRLASTDAVTVTRAEVIPLVVQNHKHDKVEEAVQARPIQAQDKWNKAPRKPEGKAEVKITITEFDAIFRYIGGFGWYQSLLFLVTCYLCVMCACVYFGQLFMSLTPPHWCTPPQYLLDLNMSSDLLKALTIPRTEGHKHFHSCIRYDVNFSQVLYDNMDYPDPSWPTIPCDSGWTYNYSLYYPTITSQLDWVCEEDWKPALAQALFFVGSTIGTPTLGWAADRWGRLPLIVFTNVLGGAAGVASAFSDSFVMFVVFRVLVGFTFEQLLMIGYMLTQEYVSSQFRTVMANVPVMVFLTGSMCALPWLAWWLADWSTFALVIHAPQFLTVVFLCTVPESARWLLSRGRVDQTLAIIQRAAKVNRRALPAPVLQGFREFGEKQVERGEQKASVLDLFKTPVLRRRYIVLIIMWCTLFVAYDGHTRNTENIGYNVFMSFTIAGLVELPADFATMVATEYLGRRHTTVWSLVLSGLAGLSITLVPEDDTVLIMVLAFVGRFLITMSMDIGHQYPVEVLPTVARGQGMGAMQTVGFLCGFGSPYIAYLSKFGPSVPYVVLGVITVVGGLVCLLLPETLNQSLPDTLHDGETFFTNQPLCYNPCASRRKLHKNRKNVQRSSRSRSGPRSSRTSPRRATRPVARGSSRGKRK